MLAICQGYLAYGNIIALALQEGTKIEIPIRVKLYFALILGISEFIRLLV